MAGEHPDAAGTMRRVLDAGLWAGWSLLSRKGASMETTSVAAAEGTSDPASFFRDGAGSVSFGRPVGVVS